MKPFTFLAAFALATPALAVETAPATPTASAPKLPAAERDWNALMDALAKPKLPDGYDHFTPSQQLLFDDGRLRQIQDLELNFIDSHPTDPRRWEIVAILRRAGGRFVKKIPPDYDSAPSIEKVIIDHDAKTARLRRIGALEQAMLEALDVPAKLSMAKYRPLFAARKVDDELTFARMKPAVEIDWAFLETKIEAYSRDYPRDKEAVWLEDTYRQLLKAKRPDAVLPRLKLAAQSANPDVRQFAEGHLRVENARSQPLELKFTAIDGREVDLANLRGKVVLVDFWAMWCGPCVAELPNVKAVYEKYHERGFEVVGIALDDSGDLEKLRQFVQKEAMPWPQHFDGRKWQTDLARQFSISSIPAALLLGKDGRLATTEARGKNLEIEVRRLLDL